jgi:hypothetical protein
MNHQTAGRWIGNRMEPAVRIVLYNHYIKIQQKQIFGAKRILYFLIQWEGNYAMKLLMCMDMTNYHIQTEKKTYCNIFFSLVSAANCFYVTSFGKILLNIRIKLFKYNA